MNAILPRRSLNLVEGPALAVRAATMRLTSAGKAELISFDRPIY